jgi:hypothetical protein
MLRPCSGDWGGSSERICSSFPVASVLVAMAHAASIHRRERATAATPSSSARVRDLRRMSCYQTKV